MMHQQHFTITSHLCKNQILAKVTRDREMLLMHHQYPDYGFDQHMGYPTKMHLLKLTQHGLIPGYRHSFKPVKELLGHPHA